MTISLVKLTVSALVLTFVLSKNLEQMQELTMKPVQKIETQKAMERPSRGLKRGGGRSGGGRSGSGSGDDNPIVTFILGLILIPFSVMLLWKNEKKLVTYKKILKAAREACHSVVSEAPKNMHNLELVCCQGVTKNPEPLID